jgi:hypothetical protein
MRLIGLVPALLKGADPAKISRRESLMAHQSSRHTQFEQSV